MATTIPGGAYLSADGKTWHDANGKVIPAPSGVVVSAEPVAESKGKKKKEITDGDANTESEAVG